MYRYRPVITIVLSLGALPGCEQDEPLKRAGEGFDEAIEDVKFDDRPMRRTNQKQAGHT